MATYVNLSVNQGLINKAKVVQARNRKSLGDKQLVQAKKKSATAQDAGKKFGTQYQRRKVGASDDGAFVIGKFRSFIDCAAGERWQEERDVWASGWPGGGALGPPYYTDNWSLDISFSRTFLSGNGEIKLFDEPCSFASVPPFLGVTHGSLRPPPGGTYGSMTNDYSTNMRVYPTGGDNAIVAVEHSLFQGIFFPAAGGGGSYVERTTSGEFAFVVSDTAIRVLNFIPDTVFPLYQNGSGPVWSAKFNPRLIGSLAQGGSRAPSPPPTIWTPDTYLNATGLREEIEPLDFISWDTTDGELFDGSNPWLLHEYTNKDRNTRQLILPEMEHPNPNYKITPVARWRPPEYPPGQNIIQSDYHLRWDDDNANPALQNRIYPNFYSTDPYSGTAVYPIGAPQGDTQMQYHTFWDWNAPDYCREEALALGFAEDDLSP